MIHLSTVFLIAADISVLCHVQFVLPSKLIEYEMSPDVRFHNTGCIFIAHCLLLPPSAISPNMTNVSLIFTHNTKQESIEVR